MRSLRVTYVEGGGGCCAVFAVKSGGRGSLLLLFDAILHVIPLTPSLCVGPPPPPPSSLSSPSSGLLPPLPLSQTPAAKPLLQMHRVVRQATTPYSVQAEDLHQHAVACRLLLRSGALGAGKADVSARRFSVFVRGSSGGCRDGWGRVLSVGGAVGRKGGAVGGKGDRAESQA